MKLYSKFILSTVLFSLISLIESCSSSKLVDVWNDASYHNTPLKKILVIAMSKDPVHRRIWEDAFVFEFLKQGVNATPSYKLFPDAIPDTDRVSSSVQANGFDGILVTSHLISGTKTRYVEGYITSEAKSRYNPFKNIDSTYYQDVEHPAYIDSLTIKRRSIEIWTIKNDGQMIWGGTSNTPELNTVEDVQNDIANLVIKELIQGSSITIV
jgi:hypothetical protein